MTNLVERFHLVFPRTEIRELLNICLNLLKLRPHFLDNILISDVSDSLADSMKSKPSHLLEHAHTASLPSSSCSEGENQLCVYDLLTGDCHWQMADPVRLGARSKEV